MTNEIATVKLNVGGEVRLVANPAGARPDVWKRITSLSPNFVGINGQAPCSRRLLEKMVGDGRVAYREGSL